MDMFNWRGAFSAPKNRNTETGFEAKKENILVRLVFKWFLWYGMVKGPSFEN